MKRFLSLTVALAMAVALVPATAFAKSDLKVDKTVTAEVGDYLYDGTTKINSDTSRKAPLLTLKADGNFKEANQEFRLKLTNAEWLDETGGAITDLNKGGTKADQIYIQTKDGVVQTINAQDGNVPDPDKDKVEAAAKKAVEDKVKEFVEAASGSATIDKATIEAAIKEIVEKDALSTSPAIISIGSTYAHLTDSTTAIGQIYAQLSGPVQDALKAENDAKGSTLFNALVDIATAMGSHASPSTAYYKAVEDLAAAQKDHKKDLSTELGKIKAEVGTYNTALDQATVNGTPKRMKADDDADIQALVDEYRADKAAFEATYSYVSIDSGTGVETTIKPTAVMGTINTFIQWDNKLIVAEDGVTKAMKAVTDKVDAFNTAAGNTSNAPTTLTADELLAEYEKNIESVTGFKSFMTSKGYSAAQIEALTPLIKAYGDAKKANVKKAADFTSDSYIELSRMTDSILVVKTHNITMKDEDELVIPLYTYLNGGTATLEVDPRESEFSSDSKTFAKTADGSTKSYSDGTKNFNDGDELKAFFVEEITPGTFETGKKITVKLTSGFKFVDGKGEVTLKEGTSSLSASNKHWEDNEFTFELNGGKSTEATTLVFKGFKVKEDGANFGTDCKITVSGAGISKESFLVGTYTDYTVALKAEDKTLPVIYAGAYAQDEEDDSEALKVTFEELVDNAWLTERKTVFRLPDGVKFAGVDVKKADKVKGGTSTLEEVLEKGIDGNEITINSSDIERTDAKCKIKAEIIFNLSVDPAFTGDIELTATGAGIANEELTTTIATAKAPLTVKSEVNEVKIDYRNVEVGDITITEPEAGLWEKGQYIALKAEEMQFESGITAEVVSGDMKLEKLDGDNVKVIKKGDQGGSIVIQVKTTSTSTPAEIKLSGIKLYLDRSLPAGDYELQSVLYNGSGKDFGKGESDSDVQFANYYDNDKNDDFGTIGFDTDSVTLLSDFVKVVTAGRDVDDATFTTKIIVPVGSDTITAGTQSIKVDSPAYINKDGYTMLPVRAITEALNGVAVVRWDDASKTATISFGQRVFSMTVGSKTMNMNGVPTGLLAAPEIKNERIFLPLRDLGYALGLSDAKIQWDSATNTATLN